MIEKETSNKFEYTSRNFFWLVIISLAAAEAFIVSYLLDARAIPETGVISKILYFSGDGLKWIITSATVFALLISRNFRDADSILRPNLSASRYYWTIPLHFFCYTLFLIISLTVFSGNFEITTVTVSLWLLTTAATALSFALLISSVSNLFAFIINQRANLLISISGGFVVLLVSLYSRVLWAPLSDFTLHGSHLLLGVVYDDLFIDTAKKLLAANEFNVHISQQCSGIDGMALATGITSAYLYLSRKHLLFPRALLLIPIAIILSLLFNVLRVALLVAIGASISPEIAIEGFHSVAGWIGSILIAVLIIFVFSSWKTFQRNDAYVGNSAEESITEEDQEVTKESNLAIAILVPFILFMATNLIAGIFKSDFDYLYPFKLAAPLIALAILWSKYELTLPTKYFEPIALGFLTAVLWVLLVPAAPEHNQLFQMGLESMPLWALVAWMGFRLLGLFLFAPVIEELVFRCYLFNRLAGEPVRTNGRVNFSVISFLITSVLFGLLHGDWIAGTAAGAIFAIARYRSSSMAAPILAHASANIFVAIWAIATQNWILL